MMNIGTDSAKLDLPSYSILCTNGTQRVTSDPARAMITGKCTDIGKVPGCVVYLHGHRTSITERHRL
jgi:hypothetical protein